MKIADQVWIAAALLHLEHPTAADFSSRQIVERAVQVAPFRTGLQVHISRHCVANRSPDPADLRMLFATARGRRRLWRPKDECHPRRRGRTHPEREDLPPQYRYLLDWYESRYLRPRKDPGRGAWALEYLRKCRPSRLTREQIRYIAESHDLDFGG